MMERSPKLLILGAHPDDAEFHAGALSIRYREQGYSVRWVSATNGQSGHHTEPAMFSSLVVGQKPLYPPN